MDKSCQNAPATTAKLTTFAGKYHHHRSLLLLLLEQITSIVAGEWGYEIF